jgi:signal peptide peptidase SppA
VSPRSFIGFTFGLALCAALLQPLAAQAQKPDILEVIELAGEIHAGMAESVARKVDEINDNAKVKAVLLVVDSPGGSVTASSALYEDLARLRAPVVVWCQSMCASGGVYLSMAPSVKYIAVRGETIGGSVGVVMQMMKFNRLLDYLKVDPKTYRSGHLKDAGNPTRAMEEAEDKYLQGIVDELAAKFYAIVEKSRGGKIKDWAAVKTARIFIGQEIVAVGLADAVATKAQVIAKAKELSGSKTIFTREELKKMSTAADGGSHYSAPLLTPSAFGDIPALIEIVKEVYSGESVKFAYRLRERF